MLGYCLPRRPVKSNRPDKWNGRSNSFFLLLVFSFQAYRYFHFQLVSKLCSREMSMFMSIEHSYSREMSISIWMEKSRDSICMYQRKSKSLLAFSFSLPNEGVNWTYLRSFNQFSLGNATLNAPVTVACSSHQLECGKLSNLLSTPNIARIPCFSNAFTLRNIS